MAVYTDVTAEDLGRFLSGYDVGELLAYKGIAEGVEINRPAVWQHLRRALEDRLVTRQKGGAESFWTLTELGQKEVA